MARYESVRILFIKLLGTWDWTTSREYTRNKEMKTWIRLICISCQGNWHYFLSKYLPPTLSMINFALIPLLYGFLRVFHYGSTEGTSLFSQNLTKSHIRSKSLHHSPLNFLILIIKVLLLPYFSLKWDIKVTTFRKNSPNSTDKTRLFSF